MVYPCNFTEGIVQTKCLSAKVWRLSVEVEKNDLAIGCRILKVLISFASV